MTDAIDVFVHDSNHSYTYEQGEYEIIRHRLSEHAVVLSYNAHSSTALMNFADSLGADYHYWHERPKHRFYPGGGIGAVVGGSVKSGSDQRTSGSTPQGSPQ